MSTVVRYRGKIRVMVRTDDHGNPHCHAVGKGCKAKIFLGSFKVVDVTGFSSKDIAEIVELVKDYEEQIMDKWKEYHGEDE